MFGGLDMKGGNQSSEKESATPKPAAASSAFSFLNNHATEIATPTPVPASSATQTAFAFLTAALSETETITSAGISQSATVVTTPGTSGFSFLQPTPTPNDENDASSKVASAPTSTTISSFDFLSPETGASSPEKSSANASGFSFLAPPFDPDQGKATLPLTGEPSSESAITMNNTTDSPSKTNVLGRSGSTSANTVPAGSGISFGGARVVSTGGVKRTKRRNRATKVGVGASQSSLPAPAIIKSEAPKEVSKESPIPISTSVASTSVNSEKNTREAASEAVRQAENFMHSKMSGSQNSPSSPTASVPGLMQNFSTDSTDEIMKAAKAAAEEAKAISSKHGGIGSRFGGFLRRTKTPPVPSINTAAPIASFETSRTTTVTQSEVKALPKVSEQEAKSAVVQPVAQPKAAPAAMVKAETKPVWTDTKTIELRNTVQITTLPNKYTSKGVENSAFTQVVSKTAAPLQIPIIKNPEDKFEDIMKKFSTEVEVSMERVSQLRQQRSTLIEERYVSFAKERLATQQISQAEAQQMTAAEEEDFELADQLQSIIDAHVQVKNEFAGFLASLNSALEEIDLQKTKVADQVIFCFKNVQEKLKDFKKEEKEKESHDKSETLKKISAISKQLSTEHERLQQDLKHLERDEKLIGEERTEVDTSISEQTGEFENQKKESCQNLAIAEEEIEELRKQLVAKQNIAADLRNEIAYQEDAILKVRVKFSRQLQRVQKKETTRKDNRNEYDAEIKNWISQKEAHETTVQAHSEALIKHEELINNLQQESELANVFESIVSEEISFDRALSEQDDSSDSDLVGLQADVVKCEAAVTEAKERLQASVHTLQNLEVEHKTLISRIPTLEATKKAAAARRDFKTAGKASKEIKEASIRLKACEEELTGDAIEKKKVVEEELKKQDNILVEKQKIANEKEKEASIATMKKLAAMIEQLTATKERLCGESSETSVKKVGAYVLDEQIKAINIEGKSYGEKYGGWEESVTTDTDVLQNEEEVQMETNEETSEEISLKKSLDDETNIEHPLVVKSKEDRQHSFRELTEKIKEVEETLEIAVEKEDYNLAGELDETLQQMILDVQALNLTDEEMEEALNASCKVTDTNEGGKEGEDQVLQDTNDKKTTKEKSEEQSPQKTDLEVVAPEDCVSEEKNEGEVGPKEIVEENCISEEKDKVLANNAESDDVISVSSTTEIAESEIAESKIIRTMADVNGVTDEIKELSQNELSEQPASLDGQRIEDSVHEIEKILTGPAS